MSHKSAEVDIYLEALAPERISVLNALRSLVFEVIPDAKERMSYRMPTYELDGKVCAFASQKNYISLYIMDTRIIERHRDELKDLDVGKSCIRFNKLEKLPIEVVKQMLSESVPSSPE
jgi:uncharacterized protein YdhG (YjbR/CyaY superfamily)